MDLAGRLRAETERQWQEWLEKAAESGVGLDPGPGFVETLLRVWQASDFVCQCCLRDPEFLVQLIRSGDLQRVYASGHLAQTLERSLADISTEAELHRVLRRFRQREMVRVIWRDISGTAPLAETLEDLSALADACIEQAVAKLYAWAVAKQGVPRDPDGEAQHLLVLGMGKLGARELNLSSDIDLIFCYPNQGELDGPRPVSNEQFFTRLCQQLIKALNSQTVDGFVFRVDTRLRPFGDSGPLVMCFDAMERYYESQAREWERYAMIKARVITGAPQEAQQLMSMLRPFVYRRYLDFGAIDSIREMKQLISRELLRKGMADNVKLGPGGIREIEFIGQAFQLIRGGRDPDLQIRPILPVLELLGERNLLPPELVQELADAYGFLRLVENRLQAWKDRQTHLLPGDDDGRQRLAASMGFSDWQRFSADLEMHRHRVQAHFDKVFAAPQSEEGRGERLLLAVWERQIEGEAAVEVLQEAGFERAEEALNRLLGFQESSRIRGLRARGRERLDQLVPMLLEAASGSDYPNLVLERLLKLLEGIARRTAYLALLVESPVAVTQLVRLIGISPWIAQQIAQQPLLLDELLDPRRLYSPLQRADLEQELATLLSAVDADDQEQQMDRLRQFANSNKLRVAAADITGVIPLMVVSDFLTDIAETVIQRVLEQVWAELCRRHGKPSPSLGEDMGFAVIGYGKLGGIELGYGSDLDLVFLHGSSDHNAMTDGDRPVANDVFYARLGQRMIHMFTARIASGLLYETDMRLRPNGNSGMLVSSIDAFSRYQREDAWTWEHQALLRARPVAGDRQVQTRFQAIRREVLSRPRDADELREQVREMREKMRTSLDKSGSQGFDIKQGRGGIADIEFMVQYCVLRGACEYPDLLDWTDNIRLLDGLESHKILDPSQVRELSDAYRTLRAAYHRNALSDLPGLIGESELEPERGLVKALWGGLMTAD